MSYPVGFRRPDPVRHRLFRLIGFAVGGAVLLAVVAAVSFPLWKGVYHDYRAGSYAAKAEAALTDKRWDDAVLYARNALRHEPKRVDAWLVMARAEEARGGKESARFLQMAAVQSGFKSGLAKEAVAALGASKQPAAAAVVALEALRRNTNDVSLMKLNGHLAIDAGSPRIAEVFLLEAQKHDPADEQVMLDLARCGVLSTNPVTRTVARERLDSLSRSSSVKMEASRVLALTLTREGDAAAVPVWDRVLALQPDDWEAGVFQSMLVARTNPAAARWPKRWTSAASDADRADLVRAMAVSSGPQLAFEFMNGTVGSRTNLSPTLVLCDLEVRSALQLWDTVAERSAKLVTHPDITDEQRVLALLWRLVASRALADRASHEIALREALAATRQDSAQALRAALWLDRAGARDDIEEFLVVARASSDAPTRVGALRRSVQLAAQRRDSFATETLARELLAVRPDDETGQILLLAALIEQPAKAALGEQRAKRIVEEKPDWIQARLMLLQALTKRGAKDEIRSQIQKLDGFSFNEPGQALIAAQAAIACGDAARAAAFLAPVTRFPLPQREAELLQQVQADLKRLRGGATP